MKSFFASAVMGLGFFVLVNASGADEPVKKEAPCYTVGVYDPKRDADSDLKATLMRAKTEGKRVLIQVGGDWCGWCHLMSDYFRENEKVASALTKDFLVVKVNYSKENENEAFLSKYPKISAYPHLFVLDADGKLLRSQNTAELEEGRGYNEKVMLAFLSQWAPNR